MSARTGGRQSMSELKLRRLIEHNQRLREDLARPRVKVSEASSRLMAPPLPAVSSVTAEPPKITSYHPCGARSPEQRIRTDSKAQENVAQCSSLEPFVLAFDIPLIASLSGSSATLDKAYTS
ncbi:hypothetical protein D9619_005395 [Psilocybe cf. subviscida]|uniref:Guanine nucleotide-binding protein subunit gamma n=1 Tax=Psilocybe cf. subviscida TaxID=2480587 RepID=A0A8H5BWC4_9AGAR|nr:hypothetical protein D9619_005395 [Psilocybe cf. subviscida]